MATQRKIGTSLNDERQQKLAEITREELRTSSSVLAHAVDLTYAAWMASGRDLKRAIRANGSSAKPKERAS